MRGYAMLAAAVVAGALLATAAGWGSAVAATPSFSFHTAAFDMPAGAHPTSTGIAIGNLDGKNGNDVVVIGFTGDLSIFLNNGHGGLQPGDHVSGACTNTGGTAGVAIGQFTSDTKPDVVVACSDAINDGFVRFKGNGDGTFDAPQRAAPIQAYYGENQDRQPVYYGNTILSMVHGRFGGEQSVVWSECQVGSGCGDFLCDLPDRYFATDFGATECSIGVNDQGVVDGFTEVSSPVVLGTFAAGSPSDWAFTNAPYDAGLNAGSLTGAVHGSTPPPDYVGGFSSDNFEPTDAQASNILPLAAGDLDKDGTSEVVSGSAGADEDKLAVYQLAGAPDNGGLFVISDPVLYATNPAFDSWYGGAAADLDGDGKPDVAVLGSATDASTYFELFRGDGTGSLGSAQSFHIADFTTEAPMASGDLNGDGVPDLVTTVGAYAGEPAKLVVLYNTTVPPKKPGTKITKATISSAHHRATFQFEAIGAAQGFQCALKRGGGKATFKSCSSPKKYSSVHKGHYTFEVRAVNAGLVDPTPATKTFKITK